MDECDLHTHPNLVQVWQRRGCPLSVPAAGQDQRRAVFGVLDYGSGDVTWQIHPRKGGDAFATFLAQFGQTWPNDQLILVMDTVGYYRSAVVRACWAEQEGWITSLWLPVSTPNLNLMERVRRFLKQKLACHRFWNDVEGLEAATATLLDLMEAHFSPYAAPGIRMVKDVCEVA